MWGRETSLGPFLVVTLNGNEYKTCHDPESRADLHALDDGNPPIAPTFRADEAGKVMADGDVGERW